MLCKKCKTAISERGKPCEYCGAKTGMAQGTVVIVLLCVVIALSVALAVYLFNGASTVEEHTPEAPQPVVGLETSEPVADAPIAEEPVQEEYLEAEPTPAPPEHLANMDMPEEDVWELVENIALALTDYYTINSKSRVIISKNGYLYNYPARDYFMPKNLTNIDSMNPEYANEHALLLFIRPDDLKEYIELPGGSELALFCAYETPAGFAIADANGRIGIINRENFHDLLELYSDDHGTIYRAENDSAEFAAIVDGILKFKDIDSGVDVRYLVFDDMYSFVVLSEKNTPEKLEQFVLINDGESWSVGLSGFEAMFMYQNIINNAYPNFNIGMLPHYNLYYDAGDIRSNISPLVEAMRTEGVTTDEDGRATFATGTDQFCYLEFENGRKLLAVYAGTDTGWVVHDINNFLHAELIMYEYDKNAPTFIIKQ